MHGRMPHDGACLICVQTSTPRRGQKSIAQRQAKRRPGYNVAVKLAPCKGKSTEAQSITFTFALTGRGMIWRGGLPRVSLRLPWAKEAIGPSAHLG